MHHFVSSTLFGIRTLSQQLAVVFHSCFDLLNLFFEDAIVETAQKGKGGREAALKKAQEENETKEMENFWFEDDLGSNNSGYYELQAVLTHKGRSSNSGHYVAWVKYKGDTWIECNDDDVNPIHVEDVLKLSGGGKQESEMIKAPI